jgi:mRNA-decapping enzyme 1B
MAQNGKPLPPQLDQNSTKELNLTVLQRMDRHVEDILTTAAHVTFYQFDVDASQWVRGWRSMSISLQACRFCTK